METGKKTGPLYFIIKEDIKRRIQEGEIKPGDVLPTENALSEEYGASRVTIRRSINELISEQVLERGFGKTATVRCETVPRSLNRLGGLHEELSQQGIKCSSFILNSTIIEANSEIAEKMNIEMGTLLFYIERLRYANGQPLCYQILYLPKALCPELDIKSLSSVSLYETLEKKFGVNISMATQTIAAVMSGYRIAALLELPEQSCMLKVSRTAYLEDESCAEYSESYYVSSRYSLNMVLKR